MGSAGSILKRSSGAPDSKPRRPKYALRVIPPPRGSNLGDEEKAEREGSPREPQSPLIDVQHAAAEVRASTASAASAAPCQARASACRARARRFAARHRAARGLGLAGDDEPPARERLAARHRVL